MTHNSLNQVVHQEKGTRRTGVVARWYNTVEVVQKLSHRRVAIINRTSMHLKQLTQPSRPKLSHRCLLHRNVVASGNPDYPRTGNGPSNNCRIGKILTQKTIYLPGMGLFMIARGQQMQRKDDVQWRHLHALVDRSSAFYPRRNTIQVQ